MHSDENDRKKRESVRGRRLDVQCADTGKDCFDSWAAVERFIRHIARFDKSFTRENKFSTYKIYKCRHCEYFHWANEYMVQPKKTKNKKKK